MWMRTHRVNPVHSFRRPRPQTLAVQRLFLLLVPARDERVTAAVAAVQVQVQVQAQVQAPVPVQVPVQAQVQAQVQAHALAGCSLMPTHLLVRLQAPGWCCHPIVLLHIQQSRDGPWRNRPHP